MSIVAALSRTKSDAVASQIKPRILELSTLEDDKVNLALSLFLLAAKKKDCYLSFQ